MQRLMCAVGMLLGVLVYGFGGGVARGEVRADAVGKLAAAWDVMAVLVSGVAQLPDATPAGNDGGTPDPRDDPDNPPGGGGEPEEPEPQPVVTGVWLAVDNNGVQCNPAIADMPPNITSVNTFDLYLRMHAPHRLLLVESNPLTAHLMITGGSVFQHPGGNNVAPNPDFFEPFPCLEFDSYLVFEDVAEPIAAPQPSSPSIIGLTAGGSAGALSETNWTGAFGAVWFLVPPPSILGEQNAALFGDDLYYVRIGRFSLPEDVSIGGQLNASMTLAGSGQTASVTAIPVPTVPAPCLGDLNADGVVDADDLGVLLGAFGISDGGDLNGDGITDADDLGILLGAFGNVCG